MIWNQTDFRLLFQINRKMVNTIWFRKDFFGKIFFVHGVRNELYIERNLNIGHLPVKKPKAAVSQMGADGTPKAAPKGNPTEGGCFFASLNDDFIKNILKNCIEYELFYRVNIHVHISNIKLLSLCSLVPKCNITMFESITLFSKADFYSFVNLASSFWCLEISDFQRVHCAQRYLFEILSNQTEIRLYLPSSDWFGTIQTSVCFQINRKMVNTIVFLLYLLIFRKVFSVCELSLGRKPNLQDIIVRCFYEDILLSFSKRLCWCLNLLTLQLPV